MRLELAMTSSKRTTTIRKRLEREFGILETILLRRFIEDSPGLGSGIEKVIVDRELRELEQDYMADPPFRSPAERIIDKTRNFRTGHDPRA
jgi:hypothetical protein